MEQKEKKTFTFYMRALHRDIGFFVIGLTVVYAVSGIVLNYRDLGFLNVEKTIERQLDPNLDVDQLGNALHLRNFKDAKVENGIVSFPQGQKNDATGLAQYKSSEALFPVNKFIALHKTNSKGKTHWFSTLYAVALLFLAISAFWMFKQGTSKFRRGVLIAAAGIVFTIIVLLL